METAIRLIIMILFIALVAIGIIMFALFGFLPIKRLSQGLGQPQPTSTIVQVILPPETSAPTTPSTVSTSTPETREEPPPVYRPATFGTTYFEIKAEGNKYSPAALTAKEGDVLTIYFQAVDSNYNISFPDFGISQTTKKGGTDFIQFQVSTAGTYKFFCRDVCSASMEGTLTVDKKS